MLIIGLTGSWSICGIQWDYGGNLQCSLHLPSNYRSNPCTSDGESQQSYVASMPHLHRPTWLLPQEQLIFRLSLFGILGWLHWFKMWPVYGETHASERFLSWPNRIFAIWNAISTLHFFHIATESAFWILAPDHQARHWQHHRKAQKMIDFILSIFV